jgi:hypothetical protein
MTSKCWMIDIYPFHLFLTFKYITINPDLWVLQIATVWTPAIVPDRNGRFVPRRQGSTTEIPGTCGIANGRGIHSSTCAGRACSQGCFGKLTRNMCFLMPVKFAEVSPGCRPGGTFWQILHEDRYIYICIYNLLLSLLLLVLLLLLLL